MHRYNTLEMNYLGRMNKKNEPEENICYSKVICMHEAPRKVLGVHILGPNSGDIIQGIALSMKLGVKKIWMMWFQFIQRMERKSSVYR